MPNLFDSLQFAEPKFHTWFAFYEQSKELSFHCVVRQVLRYLRDGVA